MVCTVLVVDDEECNLFLINSILDDKDEYHVISAKDGLEAWSILENYYQNIDVILLDRMMPHMNGIEFLEKFSAHTEFQHIPIIMQTAAGETRDIVEGIDAGVFYYLTKPFEMEVLVALIEAAVEEKKDRYQLNTELEHHKQCSRMTKSCEWEFSTLEQCSEMSTYIADYFPQPKRVSLGIKELFVNAVEHGNVGIGYDQKTELKALGIWREEVNRQQVLSKNKGKKVKVAFRREKDQCYLTIKDEGKGFNWNKYLDFDPIRLSDGHGRGIALSRAVSFDELDYVGCGNKVICKVKLAD